MSLLTSLYGAFFGGSSSAPPTVAADYTSAAATATVGDAHIEVSSGVGSPFLTAGITPAPENATAKPAPEGTGEMLPSTGANGDAGEYERALDALLVFPSSSSADAATQRQMTPAATSESCAGANLSRVEQVFSEFVGCTSSTAQATAEATAQATGQVSASSATEFLREALVARMNDLPGDVASEDLAQPLLRREVIARSRSDTSLSTAIAEAAVEDAVGGAVAVPDAPKLTVLDVQIDAKSKSLLDKAVMKHVAMTASAGPRLCDAAKERLYWPISRAVRLISVRNAKQAVEQSLEWARFRRPEEDADEAPVQEATEEEEIDVEQATEVPAGGDAATAAIGIDGATAAMLYEWFTQRLIADDETLAVLYDTMKSMSKAEKLAAKATKAATAVPEDVKHVKHAAEEQQACPTGNSYTHQPEGPSEETQETQEAEVKVVEAEATAPEEPIVTDVGAIADDEAAAAEAPDPATETLAAEPVDAEEEEKQGNDEMQLAEHERLIAELRAEVQRLEVKLRHKDTLYQQMKEKFRSREARWQTLRAEHEKLLSEHSHQGASHERQLKQEQKSGRRKVRDVKRRLSRYRSPAPAACASTSSNDDAL